MTIRKLASLCLALILALSCAGALAEEDLQAQLDAANARIAELEAQVETYYPYYISQIVATYGDGGIVRLDEVQEQYDAIAAQYQNYGLDLEAYGLAETVKRDIVDEAVKRAVLLDKAAELGLDQFDEDTEAEIAANAEAEMDQYIASYTGYFYADAEEITDDMRAEAVEYFANNGMTKDDILASLRESAALDAVRAYATQGATIEEADVQATYEALVAANQQDYQDDRTYNSDRNAGVAIAWNPEGYRAVKHVLISFDDDQAQRYSDLQSQLSSLNEERESIANPPEATEEPAEAEETEEAEATAEPVPQRTLEEVDADIAACAAEIEALYSELLPTAQEVVDAFKSGTEFDALIEKYNQDPGMQSEPTASIGYAVSADSTAWDQAFTDGAMSIENIGEISEPVYGSNGIHIIYYMADVQPGQVELEAIRDSVEQDAQEQKEQSLYDAQVDAWLKEANVEYHYESFGIAPTEPTAEALDEAAGAEEAAEEPAEAAEEPAEATEE